MVRCIAAWKWGVLAVLAAISAGARLADATSNSESLFSLYPDCVEGERERIGDGTCDPVTNNVEECDFDAGDCCECDCVSDETDENPSICVMFDCKDPSSECYVEPTPAPTLAPGADPPTAVEDEVEEVDAEVTDDSAAPLSKPVAFSAAAAAAAAATAAACGGGLAAALGW